MEYNTGSHVKVRLYSGQIVDANITSIVSRSAGRKIHIAYDGTTGVVNPAQIIEVTQAHTPPPRELPQLQPHAQVQLQPAELTHAHSPVSIPARTIPRAVASVPAKHAARKLTTSQIVRNIAEDYRRLATESDAKSDGKSKHQHESNYRWLIKLADRIKAKSPIRPS
jgi:hypothetical protein